MKRLVAFGLIQAYIFIAMLVYIFCRRVNPLDDEEFDAVIAIFWFLSVPVFILIYAAEFFCYVGDLIAKEIDNLVKRSLPMDIRLFKSENGELELEEVEGAKRMNIRTATIDEMRHAICMSSKEHGVICIVDKDHYFEEKGKIVDKIPSRSDWEKIGICGTALIVTVEDWVKRFMNYPQYSEWEVLVSRRLLLNAFLKEVEG